MDFIEGLPSSLKYNCILVVIDKFTKYAHFIPLAHPYTVLAIASAYLPQVYKLHGSPRISISDRDKTFTSLFWKELMKQLGTTTLFSMAYHSQTDGQTERLNQCLEQYLRDMCFLRPHTWAKWLSQAEWWYNMTYHTTLGLTYFEAFYGYKPPILQTTQPSPVNSVQELIQAKEDLNKALREQLMQAQHRMKQYADKKRSEREFQIGDAVYLKLQSYRQTSVALRKNLKLYARFFGPYEILERIGPIAYKLKLPVNSKIHLIFHVRLLKKKIGDKAFTSQDPLEMTDDGQLKVYPALVLDKRMVKRNNIVVTQLLVQWSNLAPEEATWEDYQVLKSQFLDFNPWGQESTREEGIVIALMENKLEDSKVANRIGDFVVNEQTKGNDVIAETTPFEEVVSDELKTAPFRAAASSGLKNTQAQENVGPVD
ncbi:hypothetical protein HRI_001210800 [Hibiscus trionum]|uniref:Integrase catalytic domain-containing protein n=1 Tax=Hibiscus trionum TaxID=183268 RepID=A0A9W7HGK9_HIBTR|nr:hypothetical protein HRI_001210800 [Hibiscus trionum]